MTSGPTIITSHEYDALGESLTDAGVLLALSELHGGVSGALCGGGPAAAERWVDEFLADHEATNLPTVRQTARELQLASWQALTGGELAFEPLLPDEDAQLEEQAQALALWCHGFLNGLGASAPDLALRGAKASAGKRTARAAGTRGDADEGSAEVSEILADFAEISRAGVDDEEAADRDSAGFALAELKEYVRVSAQIVFENLAGRRSAAARDVH